MMARVVVRVIGALAALTLMTGCLHLRAPDPFPLDAEGEAWVRETLASLSLEQRVGQMIHAHVPWNATASPEQVAECLDQVAELHLGGFITGGRNMEDGLIPILNSLQAASAVPLLFCADFEAGTGRVWNTGTRFPRQMALAATGDPETARLVGEITAREARACGVHWPLVPICDVNINPENPIINIRSYGGDVETVADFAVAFTEGVQSHGGLACAKHYPGHGDTATDSHLVLAVVEDDRERLDAVEFPPFQAAIDAGVGSVMTSHIWFPALMGDEGQIPATVSHNVLTGLLREEMGFRGLIVTDSMRMRGITNHFEAGEVAVLTVQAGTDCILVSADYREAADALIAAVADGTLTEARIAESVERILRAKAWLGLHRGTQIDADVGLAALRHPDAVAAAQDMAQRAVTAVRDERGLLPLDPAETRSVLHVAMLDDWPRWLGTTLDPLLAGLDERFAAVQHEVTFRVPSRETVEKFIELADDLTDEEIAARHGLPEARRAEIIAAARTADVVIVTAFVRVGAFKGDISIGDDQMTLLRELADADLPVILVGLGSPYLLTEAPRVPCQLLTYDYSSLMTALIPAALTGEFPLTGRLPVELPGLAPLGHGLQIPARE